MESTNDDVRREAQRFFDTRRDPYRRCRCICIAHAGGSTAVFARWRQLLPDMTILPVRLPGRGARLEEPPYVDFESLLTHLLPAVAVNAGQQFTLFGHSLGAIIAYELAFRLERDHGMAPDWLFVAGARAPHSSRPRSARLQSSDYRLSDGDLTQRLAALGGIPPEVRDSPDVLQLALPAIRADLQLYHSYRPPQVLAERRVSCPITALGGLADQADVPRQSLEDWAACTHGPFAVHLLPGDHFFLHTHARAVTQLVARCMEAA